MTLCGIVVAVSLWGGDGLGIGDAASPIDIAHWLKGDPISEFEPGRIYVLEFWATWCGPCVGNMPHLSAVQERYADRGVSVIGVSDEPLQKVVHFLTGTDRGDGRRHFERTRYALATDPDRSAFDDYMNAAEQRGLPTAFVIGRDGRIEWVGYPGPDSMDEPLRLIVEGAWDRAAHRADFERKRQEGAELWRAKSKLNMAIKSADWEAAIEALDSIIAQGGDRYIGTKIGILLSKLEEYDRGHAYARQVMNRAWDDNDWLLMQVAWAVSGTAKYPVAPGHADLELALQAITRANELTDWKDDGHLSMQAGIEFEMGRYEQAVEHQEMALARIRTLEEKVSEDQLEGFRELVDKYARKLERYRQAAGG